ncbi:MAG: hypothetical protein AAF849_11530 [Bacteroidota bacterium]
MNILRKPDITPHNQEGRFERYNLTENPFPSTPVVNKHIDDKRYNGEIYEDRIRDVEYEKVTKNFLSMAQSDPNHIRLGYLLDDSYLGRGNGKSAFALNLIQQINREHCLDFSEGKNKCFGIYLSPEPSGRTKSFYSLVDLIFDAILENGLIEYCLASLRIEALINTNDNFSLDIFEDERDLVTKLNDLNWLKENNIPIAKITQQILKKDELLSISKEFPLINDRRRFNLISVTNSESFKDYYFNTLKKGKSRINFIFNDLVNFFLASGFNGAYIIIDDFERIPDFQSDRQKREFSLELRTNLLDGISQNAKIGFYNFLLVLHAGVPRLIDKAWSDSGMEQRSPLSPENHKAKHIIYFNKLTHEHAKLLIKKYLAEYRIDHTALESEIYPFTESAISLISETAELNAAKILEKANQLLDKASENNVTLIDDNFFEEMYGESKQIEMPNLSEIANEDATNLFDKSSEPQ